MHTAGGHLHGKHKMGTVEEQGFTCCDIYGFCLHHFSIWQHFDAAVRMVGDAAYVECHVMHKIG